GCATAQRRNGRDEEDPCHGGQRLLWQGSSGRSGGGGDGPLHGNGAAEAQPAAGGRGGKRVGQDGGCEIDSVCDRGRRLRAACGGGVLGVVGFDIFSSGRAAEEADGGAAG